MEGAEIDVVVTNMMSQASISIHWHGMFQTLNTGRRVTDGLNRFVRYPRRLEPTGGIKATVGVTGRKTR
jgi:hypothetical protein